MLPAQKANQAFRLLLIMGTVVVLIAGLRAAESFFVPVLLAFFIATISFPITNWLREHKVPRLLAVLLTVLVDFAFIAGILLIVLSMVGDLQTKWTLTYQPAIYEKILGSRDWAVDTLTSWKVDDAQAHVDKVTSELLTQVSTVNVADILNVSRSVIGGIASFIGTTFIVLILTVFMLTEARMFGRRIGAICEARGPDLQRMFSATKDIQRYLGIKTAVSFATGLLAGFLCWSAQIDFFVLWGIVAFALNYIPVVGSVVAGLPPALLALIQYNWPIALAIVIGYVAINVFLGNFIEPMLLGRRFGLSTLVVVISVLFWGWIWGPVGMLLAVPLVMLLKVVLENSPEFRWIAVALSMEDRKGKKDAQLIKEAVESSSESAEDELELPEGAATEGGNAGS